MATIISNSFLYGHKRALYTNYCFYCNGALILTAYERHFSSLLKQREGIYPITKLIFPTAHSLPMSNLNLTHTIINSSKPYKKYTFSKYKPAVKSEQSLSKLNITNLQQNYIQSDISTFLP